MSGTEDVWRRKTDDEVQAAVGNLTDYTEEGQRIIRAEYERRRLGSPRPNRELDLEPSKARDSPASQAITRSADASRMGKPTDERRGSKVMSISALTGTPGPWEYKVVPFAASGASGSNRAQLAALQFEQLLLEMNEVGFEYLRMDHYSLTEAPGCVGALFGAKVVVVPYDVAIFRRAIRA